MAAVTTGDGRRTEVEGRGDHRDALLAGLVALALLGLFVVGQWARLPSLDGKVAVSSARALAEGPMGAATPGRVPELVY